MVQLIIFSNCAILPLMFSFSAQSPLTFLKMMMRLLSMMFFMIRSNEPNKGCFSFTKVVCNCFRRATMISSLISGGTLVMAMPMLSSKLSSARLSGRKSSRKLRMAFFQGMILVLVDFSSMKMRKPTTWERATRRSRVSLCYKGPHFLFSGGQIKDGTSMIFNSSLSLRVFSQSAGQMVCILMDLLEMTPQKLYLAPSQMRLGLAMPQTCLRMSSAKVVLPEWLGPMRKSAWWGVSREYQLLTVLATVALSYIQLIVISINYTYRVDCIQKEAIFIK